MSEQGPSTPGANDPPKLFTLWDKYEEAAKHFNDLNMRWRLQAMGGMLTLSTLAGFVIGGQDTIAARLRAMIILSGMLGIAWLAVALLDLLYYNELLYGAGAAIRKLEDQTKTWALPIDLSTHLDARVFNAGRLVPAAFYTLGFIPLLLAFAWASWSYCSLSAAEKLLVKTAASASASIQQPAPPASK